MAEDEEATGPELLEADKFVWLAADKFAPDTDQQQEGAGMPQRVVQTVSNPDGFLNPMQDSSTCFTSLNPHTATIRTYTGQYYYKPVEGGEEAAEEGAEISKIPIAHGQGTWELGPERFVGEFENGNFKKGSYRSRNFHVYEGDFNPEGEYHGQGTYRWPDGRTFTGEFRNGKIYEGKFENFINYDEEHKLQVERNLLMQKEILHRRSEVEKLTWRENRKEFGLMHGVDYNAEFRLRKEEQDKEAARKLYAQEQKWREYEQRCGRDPGDPTAENPDADEGNCAAKTGEAGTTGGANKKKKKIFKEDDDHIVYERICIVPEDIKLKRSCFAGLLLDETFSSAPDTQVDLKKIMKTLEEAVITE